MANCFKRSIICKGGREGGGIMDGQTITGNNNEGDNITKTKIVNHGWGGRPNKTPFIMITWGKTYLQNHISTIEECMTQGRSCIETQSEKDSNQI